jgi:hypothetical protein
MSDEIDPDSWYWDRRTHKALYPKQINDDTIRFVSVWHTEEVDDAVDGGALVPLSEIGLNRTDTTLDLIQSFRTPDMDSETESEVPGPSEGSKH